VRADLDDIARDIAGAHREPRHRVAASRLSRLTRNEAMTVQGMVLRLLGESVPVAKVAIGHDRVGVAAPIPSGMVIDNGGTIELGDRDFAGLEIEVAVRLGADLTPDIAKAGRAAMLKAIDHYLLGIELIGSRIDERAKAGPFGPLADNLVTGGYVRGPTAMPQPPQVDGLPIVVTCAGTVVQRETARHPFGDAVAPIIAYAGMADDRFGGLKKGMVVTTGSLSALLTVPRRGHVEVQLGNLPALSLTLR